MKKLKKMQGILLGTFWTSIVIIAGNDIGEPVAEYVFTLGMFIRGLVMMFLMCLMAVETYLYFKND